MCVTAQVHITTHTPLSHAPHMKQINALNRHVTCTHPVVSLMTHTGDDIEQVIRITSTIPRIASIKLKLSNVGPITVSYTHLTLPTNREV